MPHVSLTDIQLSDYAFFAVFAMFDLNTVIAGHYVGEQMGQVRELGKYRVTTFTKYKKIIY